MTPAMCLAMALYFEARGEIKRDPDAGYAVAEVIMNRVESPKYPDTVCDVVTEDRGPKDHDCQFSFYCDGLPDRMEDPVSKAKALAIAVDVLYNGERPLGLSSDHYHTTAISPYWSASMNLDGQIGTHVFYTSN